MSNPQGDNIPVHYSAGAYDRFTRAFLGRFDDLLLTRLRQEVRANSSGRALLDAGCGTARFLMRLASLPEMNHVTLTGLDYFLDMLQVSQENLRHEDLHERITLMGGDIHHLPFESRSFDFLLSRSTLHHLADPAAALVEMRRVLAPGGVALIHEVRRDADPQAIAIFNRLRDQAGVEPSRSEEKYTVDEIRQFVADAELGNEATLSAPMKGYGSLGCEVCLRAPR